MARLLWPHKPKGIAAHPAIAIHLSTPKYGPARNEEGPTQRWQPTYGQPRWPKQMIRTFGKSAET